MVRLSRRDEGIRPAAGLCLYKTWASPDTPPRGSKGERSNLQASLCREQSVLVAGSTYTGVGGGISAGGLTRWLELESPWEGKLL